jgi:hypothetical protein
MRNKAYSWGFACRWPMTSTNNGPSQTINKWFYTECWQDALQLVKAYPHIFSVAFLKLINYYISCALKTKPYSQYLLLNFIGNCSGYYNHYYRSFYSVEGLGVQTHWWYERSGADDPVRDTKTDWRASYRLFITQSINRFMLWRNIIINANIRYSLVSVWTGRLLSTLGYSSKRRIGFHFVIFYCEPLYCFPPRICG